MPLRMAVLVVAAASLSLTAGCLGIPAIYAYPKISHFPATEINAGGTEVEAFLVKTTRAYQYLPLHVDWHQEVTHLPLFVNSSSISHTSVTLEAFAGTLGPLCSGSEIEHKLKIVLYGPGYELVVLQPWEKKAIDWKPAQSIAARERTLTDQKKLRSRKINDARICSWRTSTRGWQVCRRMASDFAGKPRRFGCDRRTTGPFVVAHGTYETGH